MVWSSLENSGGTGRTGSHRPPTDPSQGDPGLRPPQGTRVTQTLTDPHRGPGSQTLTGDPGLRPSCWSWSGLTLHEGRVAAVVVQVSAVRVGQAVVPQARSVAETLQDAVHEALRTTTTTTTTTCYY
ncbi:hypothetical protein EYF80_066871 [Liparis tanakae]|uniref:Uncharacterized protein n=1 Tax=Liparis tanakae TaxID=230148 RepID=A0A4Z2E2P5_9TELE|nr:hypothetical protein EYF80_066871 [Liparis tanakae]